jgi:lantibiotic modifying enzyme
VAVFLAQLTRLTGIARYGQAARRAVSPVPQLLAVLDARTDLLAQVGCGSASGLGGMSYALARLATLLDDPELRGWAETSVALTARAVGLSGTHGPHGWLDGTAGCLAAMSAVSREIGSAAAGDLAATCADLLADLAERTAGRCEPAPGFAAGPAGVGWALARYAAPGSRHASAARQALRHALPGPDLGDGWCRGAAGLLLARSCLGEDAAALHALAERPVLDDMSLCHGELGIADAALTADPDHAPRVWRRRSGHVLNAVLRHGPACATPGGITTPGLLHGLAGIGYGLLRLGFTRRIPSVLLLEPTPPAGSTDPATPAHDGRTIAPGKRG